MKIKFKAGNKSQTVSVTNVTDAKKIILIAKGELLKTDILKDIDFDSKKLTCKVDGQKVTLNELINGLGEIIDKTVSSSKNKENGKKDKKKSKKKKDKKSDSKTSKKKLDKSDKKKSKKNKDGKKSKKKDKKSKYDMSTKPINKDSDLRKNAEGKIVIGRRN